MKSNTKLHIANLFLVALGLGLVVLYQFASLDQAVKNSGNAARKEWAGNDPFRTELSALLALCSKGALLNGDGEKNITNDGCTSTVEHKMGKPIQDDMKALHKAENTAALAVIDAAPLPIRWLIKTE
jgi:hypothetical protein